MTTFLLEAHWYGGLFANLLWNMKRLFLYFMFRIYLSTCLQVVTWCYNVWDARWLSPILCRWSYNNMQKGQHAFWFFCFRSSAILIFNLFVNLCYLQADIVDLLKKIQSNQNSSITDITYIFCSLHSLYLLYVFSSVNLHLIRA